MGQNAKSDEDVMDPITQENEEELLPFLREEVLEMLKEDVV